MIVCACGFVGVRMCIAKVEGLCLALLSSLVVAHPDRAVAFRSLDVIGGGAPVLRAMATLKIVALCSLRIAMSLQSVLYLRAFEVHCLEQKRDSSF